MAEQVPYRVMLVIHEEERAAEWIESVKHIPVQPIEYYLRSVIEVPADRSISEATRAAQTRRDLLSKIAKASPIIHDDVRVLVDYDATQRLLEDAAELRPDLMIIQWNFAAQPTAVTERLLQHVECDLVLLDGIVSKAPQPVLLSLRGAPNMNLGLFTAKLLAGEGSVTLYHSAQRSRYVPSIVLLLENDPQVSRIVTAGENIREGLLQEMQTHKALVMGASFARANIASSHLSPLIGELRASIDVPIALVRTFEPQEVTEPLATTIVDHPRRVERWFAENTFDSSEFADLRHLVELKEKQNLTISIGLPALNEEKTVGNVILTLKKALMDEYPLVDEIVLIDSMSTDRTVEIAQEIGIPVYRHPEILPEVGSVRGKGEALWKSLAVLKGDLITWVDTDITNIHPRFVYGLLGPLLKYPRLQYVKGFYQRPIKVGNKMQETGGGRVTELVARPLLNMFYPELSGLLQPLSGEYAGRREALMNVPFFSGYGVETGLLLDLVAQHGLDAIAQCNLEVRVHHNQTLVGLSKMAFAILQVFMARLDQRYNLELLNKANRTMNLIRQDADQLALEGQEIGDIERPPMASVLAAYASKPVV